MSATELVIEESEIPVGGRKVVRVGSVDVGIFNIDGVFHAISNWCPHEGGPVCTGYLTGTVQWDKLADQKTAWVHDGEILCCPWHGYEFEIKSGKCITRGELRLRRYKVHTLDGKVKVEI